MARLLLSICSTLLDTFKHKGCFSLWQHLFYGLRTLPPSLDASSLLYDFRFSTYLATDIVTSSAGTCQLAVLVPALWFVGPWGDPSTWQYTNRRDGFHTETLNAVGCCRRSWLVLRRCLASSTFECSALSDFRAVGMVGASRRFRRLAALRAAKGLRNKLRELHFEDSQHLGRRREQNSFLVF